MSVDWANIHKRCNVILEAVVGAVFAMGPAILLANGVRFKSNVSTNPGTFGVVSDVLVTERLKLLLSSDSKTGAVIELMERSGSMFNVSTNHGTLGELVLDGELVIRSDCSVSLLKIGSRVLTLTVSSGSFSEDVPVSTNRGTGGCLELAAVMRLSTIQCSELIQISHSLTMS